MANTSRAFQKKKKITYPGEIDSYTFPLNRKEHDFVSIKTKNTAHFFSRPLKPSTCFFAKTRALRRDI